MGVLVTKDTALVIKLQWGEVLAPLINKETKAMDLVIKHQWAEVLVSTNKWVPLPWDADHLLDHSTRWEIKDLLLALVGDTPHANLVNILPATIWEEVVAVALLTIY